MPSEKHDSNQTTADISQPAPAGSSHLDTLQRPVLGPDTSLAGRYRVVRLIGQGATGSVYEAVDEARSGWRVAVKLLTVHQPHALYRLKNEFRALSETVHPNLVGLHGLASDARGWFVVMDLVDPSSDFRSYVRGSEDALDVLRLRSALARVVHGVAAIHAAGKLHRDLKPSNVLVTGEGRVVIVDFGLVGDQDPGGPGSTLEGWFAGTPAYAAPEQITGTGVGPKADLYALGVMLFEALTGRLPFEADTVSGLLERKRSDDAPDPHKLAPEAPADLCALCSALLQRDPRLRPDVPALLALLDQEPVAPSVVTSLPFVGRLRELSLLNAASVDARAGGSVLALVSGEPGIGKTSLVARFLELMRVQPRVAVLHGRCHVQEQVPYNAFDMLIDALGRYLSRLPSVEAASVMPRDAALLARMFPTLARVPAVLGMPPVSTRELSTALLRTRAFAALKELLLRIADRGLMVIAIEDLQWSDDDSAELLRELLRGPDVPAGLFVCTFRTGSGEPGRAVAALRAATAWSILDLQLAPLDQAAAAELARATLGSIASDPGLDLLIDEAAGNPFLIKELANAARARGRVGGLQDVVRAQSVNLDEGARGLLELVCIAGEPVELSLAMRAAQVQPTALPHVLTSSLIRSRAREGREYLESSHDRVHEAVSEALTPERKRALHAALARELSADAQADPERVAHHYRSAGLAAEAAPYTIQAAQRAWDALALGRAAELYELALAASDGDERTALERSLADVYASAGRLKEAAEGYQRLLSSATNAEQRRSIMVKTMLLSLLGGHIERGLALMVQLCREFGILPPPNNPLLLWLVQAWLSLRYMLGPRVSSLPIPTTSPPSALASERLDFLLQASRGMLHAAPEHGNYFATRALIAARRSRDARSWPLVIAGADTWRAVMRGVAQPRELEAIQGALELAERQGDPDTLALVLTSQGCCALFTCRVPEAHSALQRAEEVLAACTRPVIQELSGPRNGRLSTFALEGNFGQLIRHGEQWINEAKAVGDYFGELTTRLIAAQGFLALDDPDAAREELARLDPALLGKTLLSVSVGWRGELSLYEGDLRTAFFEHERARRSQFTRAVRGLSAHRTFDALFLARTYLMAARGEERTKYLHMARAKQRRLAREGFPMGPAAAVQIGAALAAARGDQEQALRELRQAMQLYETCGVALHAAALRHHAGKLIQGEQGTEWVAQARASALSLGVKNPERWFHSLAPGFSD